MIDHANISRFDLNLLVAFDALMSEGNVTRAAHALGVSQPTMSHNLSRLRQFCGDDLFVRTKTGMTPTARAREIAPEVRSMLQAVQSCVIGDGCFEPVTSARNFTIAMSDFIEAILLPGLIGQLSATAPAMSVSVYQSDTRDPRDLLEVRHLDLAIGTYKPSSRSHHAVKLWTDCGAVLHRRDAAGPSGALDLETFRNGRHVIFRRSQDHSDLTFENCFTRRGITLQSVVTTPHLFIVPYLVQSDNLFAPVPCSLGQHLATMHGLAVTRLPFALRPGFDINLVWHSSAHDDPAHQWLRRVIKELVGRINPLAGGYGGIPQRLAGADEFWAMSPDCSASGR